MPRCKARLVEMQAARKVCLAIGLVEGYRLIATVTRPSVTRAHPHRTRGISGGWQTSGRNLCSDIACYILCHSGGHLLGMYSRLPGPSTVEIPYNPGLSKAGGEFAALLQEAQP
jgi:hypothetical protein